MSASEHHVLQLLRDIKYFRLDTFARFDDYSVDDVIEIYNGIGADWMPASLRDKITQHARLFEPAALEHDVYTYHLVCAGSREESPLSFKAITIKNTQGNKRFYGNCKVLVKAELGILNFRRYYYLWLAHKFFLALEKFGILGIESSIKYMKNKTLPNKAAHTPNS